MQIEVNKEYQFDNDQFLWRYMDLHRLIYFLNSENIFFSPLYSFFDPLEGVSENHLHAKQFIDEFDSHNAVTNSISNSLKKELKEEKEEIKEKFKSGLQEIQRTYFASCWYLGVRESLAMWSTYSNKDSVAIKCNPVDLCEKMINSCKKVENEDFQLMVHGKVEYFKISPFDPDDKELKNAGHRFKGFMKDLSYKHEEEFRFLAVQCNSATSYPFFEILLEDLYKSNFAIVTHPYMEPWKYNNIYNILQSKGLEDKLVRSEIPTRRQVFDTP